MAEKRLFFKCLAGKLAIFLLLWGAVMAPLLWINCRWAQQDALTQQYRLSNSILMGQTSFSWSSEQKDWISCWLTVSGCEDLKAYGGQVFARLYDDDGQRLGQSQLLTAAATLYSEDNPSEAISCHMLLDQTMTDEQLVAAARLLNRWGTGYYQERIGREVTIGSESEAVGWLEDNVFYVRKLTLQLGEEQVVLADADIDLFPSREPETCRIGWVEFSSPLTGRGGPEKRLEQYREMEAEVDDLEAANPGWAKEYMPTVILPEDRDSSNAYLYKTAFRAMAVSYRLPSLYALAGLGPVILLTLGAAAALAVLTAWLEYRTIRRERAFTRAAAHELKTPLAILRAHAESLREDIDPAKREEYLDVVLSETDRMAALTAALLDLARLERGEALKREPVELSALVREVFDRLALPLEQKGITLKLDLSQVWTEGDRARLESAAANLASNALRHCTPGGAITVKVGKEGRWAVLTVDNDGDNIPERELRRIWQPFYRSDQSRSRDTGGTGLGLAIVKAAMKAHGGECSASNRAGGVIFRVSLPSLQSAQ